MIKTTPTYIKGDNLSFKEYFKHVFAGEHLLYTSRWNGGNSPPCTPVFLYWPAE